MGQPTLLEATRRARDEFGVDPVGEPRRTAAIVADLVGDPGVSTTADVAALRAVLLSLADAGVTAGQQVSTTVVAGAAASTAVSGDVASRALSVAVEVLGLDVVAPGSGTATTNRWLPVVAGVGLLAAVGVGAVLASGGGGTPDPDESPTASATTDDDSTTEPVLDEEESDDPPSQVRRVATFEPVQEGDVVVQRGWVVTESHVFVGTTQLTSDAGLGDGRHAEVIPPAVLALGEDPVWEPEPSSRLTYGAAYSAAALAEAGNVFLIRYTVQLPDDVIVDDATLLAWFDEWLPEAEALRPAFDDLPPIVRPDVGTDAG